MPGAPGPDSGPYILKIMDASWLDANWMFISAALCPIVLIVVLIAFMLRMRKLRQPFSDCVKNPYFSGWLCCAFYLAHQVEEHAYDLRGWRYAFVPDFNHGLGTSLFGFICGGAEACPLDPALTTYINVPCIWIGFPCTMIVAHLAGGRYAYAGLCNWGTSVVNGAVGHILPAILGLRYDPGLAQSLVMVPVGIYLMSQAGKRYLKCCIVCGVLFHVIGFGLGIPSILISGFPAWSEIFVMLMCSICLPLMVADFMAPTWPPRVYDEPKREVGASDYAQLP